MAEHAGPADSSTSDPAFPAREVLTVEQIADYLQVHPETVRRWLRDRQLIGMNLSGKSGWRVRRTELERFMLALEGGSEAGPQ